MVCLLCALRAIMANERPPAFDETLHDHMRRVHRDATAAHAEKEALLAQLAKRDPAHVGVIADALDALKDDL